MVDLDALAAALKDGHLLGAAIDVFPKEPKAAGESLETPLRGLENVILTPHIGGSTAEAQERIGQEVARKLLDYSDIGSTLGAVNFPTVQLPENPHGTRFMHVHTNAPGVMLQINEIFSREDCNVTAQYLQTAGELGYVVVEADTGGMWKRTTASLASCVTSRGRSVPACCTSSAEIPALHSMELGVRAGVPLFLLGGLMFF